jgi:uroporphyrin-III C-methyltransferase/precorrin-2 dehydrogenase/sirohydrochlorin ferrochelatase
MTELLPLFLNLSGRRVLLVGAGPVAASKLQTLLAAGADVAVVAPDVDPAIARAGVAVERRAFVSADLDGVWLVVAAATPGVNRLVARAAEARRIFVNAVDDPANASAFLGGVVRRNGVTFAISTSGQAPALAGLLREGLDAVLPADLASWLGESRRQRQAWRRDRVPMPERRPLLLEALNEIYGRTECSAGRAEALPYEGSTDRAEALPYECSDDRSVVGTSVVGRDFSRAESSVVGQGFSPAESADNHPAVRVPWTSGPEDSWM